MSDNQPVPGPSEQGNEQPSEQTTGAATEPATGPVPIRPRVIRRGSRRVIAPGNEQGGVRQLADDEQPQGWNEQDDGAEDDRYLRERPPHWRP